MLRRALLHAIARLLKPLYSVYCGTIRIQFINDGMNPWRLPSGTNAIYVFWHSKTFLLLPLYKDLSIGVLTLRDWKNIFYDALCRLYHYQTVPVTSFQKAGVELKNLLGRGCHIALAPDGPRGPAGILKHGALRLSRTTGRPIVAVNIRCEKSFRLRRRWDRYEIPLPFTSAVFTCHDPIQVTGGNFEEAEKMILKHLSDL